MEEDKMKKKINWTLEEDKKLVEIVVQRIAQGMNQSEALLHASSQIGRTFNACTYRINNYLRKEFDEELSREKSNLATIQSSMMVTQRLEEQTSQPGISKEIKIKDISEDSQLNPNLLSWESIIQSIEDKRQLCEYLEEQNRQLSHENILLKIDMKRINEIALKGEEFHVLKNLLQRIANSQITNEITQLENEGFKNIG